MKKLNLLICILLTFTFCNAQELVIIEYNDNEILTVNHDKTKVICGGAELITINLLLEYEKECYNDSSVAYYWTFCDMECWEVSCIKGDTNWFGQKCPEYWIHKTPIFSDFLKWIRKQKSLNLSKTEKN